MTEDDWLACTDPGVLLNHVKGTANEPPLRLFACACVRAVWPMSEESEHPAVAVAERFADGHASAYELAVVRNMPWSPSTPWIRSDLSITMALRAAATATTSPPAWAAALNAAKAAAGSVPTLTTLGKEQCDLFRDVCDPFHPTPIPNSGCLTPTVIAIAWRAYEERDFADLPILGDALEDAGCTNSRLLDHLRKPGPHIRGCWALDSVLCDVVLGNGQEQPAGMGQRPLAAWLLSAFTRRSEAQA